MLRLLLAAAGFVPTLLCAAAPSAADGNRLTYLDQSDPYYVGGGFAKLTTPQWLGEPGVRAVVILAIDDMREPARYESFLRPILERLKRIDGRAPVSIMTCRVDPGHPRLQQWLKEGVSIEAHTYDHPCPILKDGDLAKAKATYDRCVDLLFTVPGMRPVAFRTPCCDSLNTNSPRMYAEIFNRVTPQGHFLTADSSVFHLFTADDPDLPRQLVIDPDNRDKFRKYIPTDRVFVNTIFNYPYPYVIGRLCWEFSCMMPSDWDAHHLHGSKNPVTVRDWKAALDATVIKQGTFTMVFHPHGWIGNDQMVELIDYAVSKYGDKVKFLNLAEAQRRIDQHLLGGQPLRGPDGEDNGVRLIDLDADGYLDVVVGNDQVRRTRLWSPRQGKWLDGDFPTTLVRRGPDGRVEQTGVRFGVLGDDGQAVMLVVNESAAGAWRFEGRRWVAAAELLDGLTVDGQPVLTSRRGHDRGVRLRDLDRDGRCELIVSNDRQQAVFTWSPQRRRWQRLPFALPSGTALVDADGRDLGLRFVDVDEDGYDDVLMSNEHGYSLHLFTSMKLGWSQRVKAGKRSDPEAIPMITRNGTNNGAWFHSRHLWVQNEDTAKLKDLVARCSFDHLLRGVEPKAKDQQASLRCMQARPGFQVELVAAEPLTEDPIAFEWGPDGKLWVVEMADYPLGLDDKGKFGGRIRFLEDTDGDGRYDRSTVFIDGLGYPSGVTPWRNGVLVTCAPEIFYAEDTDGDGRADVHRTLFSGFGEGNQQHRVNGFVWGLDNWLYCANGDSDGKVRSHLSGQVVDIRGRDFRIRPDEGQIELQTGRTQFGRCRDDWGNWFGCNNSNPMFHFVLDDHYLRRNPHVPAPNPRVQVSVTPGAAPVFSISRPLPRFNDLDKVNRITSACSVIVYRDELFGPEFAGNSFVCEPVHNLVHREVMSARGVTFTSQRAADERESEFLASRDNWFRPCTVKTGPDGALWVADMYRYVIEHPEWIPDEWEKRLDLRAGHDKGRIYRVYPVGKRPRPIPRLADLDTASLVAALDSPNGWQRDMVQQLLLWRGDKAAVKPLTQMALHGRRALARLHALCTLDGLGAVTPELLQQALADPHPGIRRHAVRISEPHLNDWPQLGDALLKLVDDSDPHVRMQLAYSLGEWSNPRAGGALGRLAVRDADDPYIMAAVMSSAVGHLDGILQGVLAKAEKQPPPAGTVSNLLALATATGNQQALARLLNVLAAANPGGSMPWRLGLLSDWLQMLQRRRDSLARLAKRADPPLREAIGRLGPLFDAARRAAADAKLPANQRADALRLLGRGPTHRDQDLATLASLLSPQTPTSLQVAAVQCMARAADPKVPELMLARWRALGPTARAAVLDALLQRQPWTRKLLAELAAGRLPPSELGASRRQQLLQHPDTHIRQQAAKLLRASNQPDRAKIVAAYLKQINHLTGDPRRGREVFKKSCSSCHRVAGIGEEVGANLTALTNRSPDALVLAILDPNQALETKYVSYLAATTDGRVLTGMLANETSNSITLVDQKGQKQVLLRSDLEALQSTGKSLMPEGLEQELTPQNVADLIAFLNSSGPPRKSFPGNHPEVVQPEALRGDLYLLATNCEIYGDTLVFEDKYRNLGFWGSTNDLALWQFRITRPGRYAIMMEWACADQTAGNSFILEVDQTRLGGIVSGTGSWDNYHSRQVGEVELDSGLHQLAIRPAGRLNGYLMDLKGLRLRRVGPLR